MLDSWKSLYYFPVFNRLGSGMPKNISIYIPDELLKRMNKFQEVNWSEIARDAIVDYLDGRIRIDERLRESDQYLNELRMIRNQFMHNLDNFENLQRMEKAFELTYADNMKVDVSIGLRTVSQIELAFKIFNLLDYDLLFDRLLYEFKLIAKGKILASTTGSYLRRHKINSRGSRSFSDYVTIDSNILKVITEKILPQESDVSWNLSASSYYDSERGIIEHSIQEDGTIAHSNWKKWYNSWLTHLIT